jgi:hypothetical protein
MVLSDSVQPPFSAVRRVRRAAAAGVNGKNVPGFRWQQTPEDPERCFELGSRFRVETLEMWEEHR